MKSWFCFYEVGDDDDLRTWGSDRNIEFGTRLSVTEPEYDVNFTGLKYSKQIVSREEAIAIIEEEYRCVLLCLFIPLYLLDGYPWFIMGRWGACRLYKY